MQLACCSIRENKKLIPKVKALYRTAFPKNEQLWWPALRFLTRSSCGDIHAYLDGNTFCGFTVSACAGSVCYVLFFAVEEGLRGQGYGGAILDALKKANPGRDVVVLIEPPIPEAENFDQRVRRLRFYERNGFYRTGLMSKEIGGAFDLLATAPEICVADYKKVFKRMTLGFWNIKVWEKNV